MDTPERRAKWGRPGAKYRNFIGNSLLHHDHEQSAVLSNDKTNAMDQTRRPAMTRPCRKGSMPACAHPQPTKKSDMRQTARGSQTTLSYLPSKQTVQDHMCLEVVPRQTALQAVLQPSVSTRPKDHGGPPQEPESHIQQPRKIELPCSAPE